MEPSETPLIEALQALISEDEAQFRGVVQQLMSSGLSMISSDGSTKSQLQIIEEILIACPRIASLPRKSDNAYPLHLAASIGDVHLGCLIASTVSVVVHLCHCRHLLHMNSNFNKSYIHLSTPQRVQLKTIKGKHLYMLQPVRIM